MAYAGICGDDDLQAHSDPYFSQRSIEQIQTYVTRNAAPAATADPRQPSPVAPRRRRRRSRSGRRSPLTGTATDADGDPLVYTWEQNDTGAAAHLLGSIVRTTGPAVSAVRRDVTERTPTPGTRRARREPPAAADATRTFPDVAQIAADNTDAPRSRAIRPSASDVDCYSELLPDDTPPAMMDFRLTARDRNPPAAASAPPTPPHRWPGGTPFRVTAPPPDRVTGGATSTVRWDVAGTAAAPFDVTAVRITLLHRRRADLPLTVTGRVAPNDGSRDRCRRAPLTTGARFQVEAVGNVFFDVSHGDHERHARRRHAHPHAEPGTPAEADPDARGARGHRVAHPSTAGRRPHRRALPSATTRRAHAPSRPRPHRAGSLAVCHCGGPHRLRVQCRWRAGDGRAPCPLAAGGRASSSRRAGPAHASDPAPFTAAAGRPGRSPSGSPQHLPPVARRPPEGRRTRQRRRPDRHPHRRAPPVRIMAG